MTGKTEKTTEARSLPADLADVALIDAATCAAAGAMSVSWWHDEVRNGRAPQPAIRATRCTRWRLADVREFWRTFAAADADTGEALKARATKASAAAMAKRKAKSDAQACA